MKPMNGLAMDYRGIHKNDIDRKKIERHRAANVERGFAPLDLTCAVRDTPVAIVGYGPSLAKTVERLRHFSGPIITVSKAHDYLIEQLGFAPHGHVDVDISTSKLYCIERPTSGVEYMMASKMLPDVLDNIPDPRIFHVPIWGDDEVDPRYPRVNLCFDASMTAAAIMYLRGYYNQHWFGIDYGLSEGKTYPGKHPGILHTPFLLDLDGETYTTSEIMIHGLLMAERFVYIRPVLDVTIHGNGLLGTYLTKRRRVSVAVKP